MKMIITCLMLMASGITFACSCSYEYRSHTKDDMSRIGELLNVESKLIEVTDFKVRNTALAYIESSPILGQSCGCVQYVKRIWNISFERNGINCVARAIHQVWNDKMKVRSVECGL